ncbi:unnamed protein product [Lymnaea stagnalis]|uniref:Uncharacterized protein n=1 Tax=Lymnaea stagnalis TaxID=6523 RepID=A0AAV2HEV9_LYMST
MPFSGQQPKHTGDVHSPKAAGSAQVWPSPGDPSQNYAEVNKLRGYTFSNLMLATDAPAPHHPDKTAVASENYWHLAPMTSPESVTSWQTGDVLDYIDGLHDSMSPKRRENIYILLNNKKTRAKFSESLEIESRLLSRGLISNSCEGPSDKASDVLPTVKSGTVKPVVIRRKGAIAPVSSTYV